MGCRHSLGNPGGASVQVRLCATYNNDEFATKLFRKTQASAMLRKVFSRQGQRRFWERCIQTAGRWWEEWCRVWQREPERSLQPCRSETPSVLDRPLRRLVLTDEVCRTLFEEFAMHRRSARGREETGWFLLGRREGDEAVALATLPAGALRDSGVAHVRFNSEAQALASQIVRQRDRKLLHLGVVHTHPGSLRHPSEADYRGDIQWVRCLRGQEGVFGIGTADADDVDDLYARQPLPNVQCLHGLRLSWYSLKHQDRRYRPLPYHITLGPDLAKPLHAVWDEIEQRTDQISRLFRQQARVAIDVVQGQKGPALSIRIPLEPPPTTLCVLLENGDARYFLLRDDEALSASSDEARIDRAVYLMLAELARPASSDASFPIST
ncbi:MAG: hypothetical protein KatS3mg105_4616 [Gemmatales bacterium]|nr:MAG: hypothetical protein KatS3mg105_4616 [Gemmatales bacterium]